MISLRPYQLDLVEATRKEMHDHKSVLVQLATGAGKTALASYMVASAAQKGSPVFFCVHRRDLIKQTSLTFDNFNIKHSYIAAGLPMNPYSLAHICSIDTLRGRLDKVPVPKIVFIDECHLSNSVSWSNIIQHFRNKGAWVIGLSASPTRLDGTGLGKNFSTMVQGPSMSWLIENKYLSDYRMYAPSVPDLSGIAIRGGDYAADQLSARLDDDPVIVGDMIKHYKLYAPGKRAVAYCVSRRHSENVARKFCEAGISAHHIDGETSMQDRARIISDFADGKIDVLTNAALITTGFDLASQVGRDVSIECIIDGAPTKSEALYLQKCGRGLRYKPEPAIFLDHAGNSAQHGLPDEEREWTLADKPKRRGGKATDEKLIPVRQCPQCYFVHKPKPECPSCTYIYPIQYREIEEREGELAEIKKSAISKQKRMEVGAARTLEDLKRIADERGYAKGWIFKMAQLKNIRA